MALFNEDGLKNKLDDLNLSQQSIQTLSLWLIHHKKHAHTVVNVWMKELMKASDTRKLTFMYLANDVIQNSKKKGPEYSKEFGKRLPKVFEHLGAVPLDDKSKRGLDRLLTVWEQRGVFGSSAIHSFKRSYEGLKSLSKSSLHPAKRPRRSSSVGTLSDEGESGVDSGDGGGGEDELNTPPSPHGAGGARSITPSKPPPDPETFIAALQSLEGAATADAVVRERIASLPTEVSDVDALKKLQDLTEARALQEVVSSALTLLLDYTGRLAREMEARKNVARLLHDSIQYHKEKLATTEENLEEYRLKLQKVFKVKAELKAHLQNLPDISRLPNMGSTLAPLPSAGDLFTS